VLLDVHDTTKRGTYPGNTDPADVVRLTGDGRYRSYPDAPRLPLAGAIPDRLVSLHGVTRARRSPWEYTATPIARADLDAMLTTACGVTGSLPVEGDTVSLRAYPSGGALYTIEMYLAAINVQRLDAGVYHLNAIEGCLELLRPGFCEENLRLLAVPDQQRFLTGVGAVVFLAANFPRPEREYGQGSYRMIAMEAGHISQNLLLAAAALGLGARPIAGLYDSLVNNALGFEGEDEQFMLAVLLGTID
jgi:SagB-type dehydrogenase family enzyme